MYVKYSSKFDKVLVMLYLTNTGNQSKNSNLRNKFTVELFTWLFETEATLNENNFSDTLTTYLNLTFLKRDSRVDLVKCSLELMASQNSEYYTLSFLQAKVELVKLSLQSLFSGKIFSTRSSF